MRRIVYLVKESMTNIRLNRTTTLVAVASTVAAQHGVDRRPTEIFSRCLVESDDVADAGGLLDQHVEVARRDVYPPRPHDLPIQCLGRRPTG